jgi:hypothetical protein
MVTQPYLSIRRLHMRVYIGTARITHANVSQGPAIIDGGRLTAVARGTDAFLFGGTGSRTDGWRGRISVEMRGVT